MKVLIVDDHPIVRTGLRRLLAAQTETEIWDAANGKEALSVFKQQRPHLVILDLSLPGIGGLEVIARLKVVDPAARVLVLSMHDDQLHVTRALRAGAAGYVSKNAPPDELLEAIRRVSAGQNYVEHEIAEELVFSGIRLSSNPLGDLSSRDLEILRLLAEGCTLPHIADTVGISYKTAANNCSRIKSKLGAASTAELIRVALQCGLVGRDAGF
jgi:two-component system, NarL family, invasion response regulator UvrY